MQIGKCVLIAGLAVFLAACAGGGDELPEDGGYDLYGDDTGGASSSGMEDDDGYAGSELDGGEALPGPGGELGRPENRIIYFAFDQAQVQTGYAEILKGHGQWLADNPSATIRLEGHADERGSREYNLGLGERRAQAVRQMLMLQGAQANQIQTVSFGEERPTVIGSDEEAWALNRRVELVYGS